MQSSCMITHSQRATSLFVMGQGRVGCFIRIILTCHGRFCCYFKGKAIFLSCQTQNDQQPFLMGLPNYVHFFEKNNSKTGLSLRGGGRGFPPDTFIGKQKKNRTKRNPQLFDFPLTCRIYPANLSDNPGLFMYVKF